MPNGGTTQKQDRVQQIQDIRTAQGQPTNLTPSAETLMPTGVAPLPRDPLLGVLPPSNPVGTSDAVLQSAISTVPERLARANELAAQIQPLLTREAALSQPQSPSNPEGEPPVSWRPKFEHISGPGSLARDALRGLLYGVSLTGPGQAVVQRVRYPAREQWETRRADVAQRIAEIQKQQELTQQPIGAVGELAYHQELIGTKERLNDIRQQLADEKTKNDTERTDIERQKLELARQKAEQAVSKWRQQLSMEMKTFQLRAKNLDRETARDQMDAMLRDQANENYAARTAAGQSEKEASLAAAQDISQTKMEADKWFQRTFGLLPKIPPRQSSAGNSNKGAGAGGGTVRFQDSRGGIHDIPAANLPAARQRDPGLRVLTGGR